MGAGSDPADNNQLFKNNVFGSLKSLGHDVNMIHFDHFLSICVGDPFGPQTVGAQP